MTQLAHEIKSGNLETALELMRNGASLTEKAKIPCPCGVPHFHAAVDDITYKHIDFIKSCIEGNLLEENVICCAYHNIVRSVPIDDEGCINTFPPERLQLVFDFTDYLGQRGLLKNFNPIHVFGTYLRRENEANLALKIMEYSQNLDTGYDGDYSPLIEHAIFCNAPKVVRACLTRGQKIMDFNVTLHDCVYHLIERRGANRLTDDSLEHRDFRETFELVVQNGYDLTRDSVKDTNISDVLEQYQMWPLVQDIIDKYHPVMPKPTGKIISNYSWRIKEVIKCLFHEIFGPPHNLPMRSSNPMIELTDDYIELVFSLMVMFIPPKFPKYGLYQTILEVWYDEYGDRLVDMDMVNLNESLLTIPEIFPLFAYSTTYDSEIIRRVENDFVSRIKTLREHEHSKFKNRKDFKLLWPLGWHKIAWIPK